MLIEDALKLLPDDAFVSFRNNNGDIIVTIGFKNNRLGFTASPTDLEEQVLKSIKLMFPQVIENTDANS